MGCVVVVFAVAAAWFAFSAGGALAFGTPAAQAQARALLVKRLAARELALEAPGGYQASPVLAVRGRSWLVLEGADAADPSNAPATVSPYADSTVVIYRWISGGWSEQGSVRGAFGPVGGCCGISAVSLTGSHDPDFALEGGGAADTLWLVVISDVGGRWHAVPFDYGYDDTAVVNGDPIHGAVRTMVDASSAAGGPTTLLDETFQHGVFRPAPPPGRSPPCDREELQLAAGDGELEVFYFAKFACADGWAMAIGTGAGYSGQLVGLFEADGKKWLPIEVDNGNDLGSYPGIYDIPLPLLRRLTAGFGPTVRPALATAPLFVNAAMGADGQYLNGIDVYDGTDWFVNETPTGHGVLPGADAAIYRWSGSTWLERGHVNDLPPSLNYWQSGFADWWFEPVAVPGTIVPGFALHPDAAVLTDAGGTWHIQRH